MKHLTDKLLTAGSVKEWRQRGITKRRASEATFWQQERLFELALGSQKRSRPYDLLLLLAVLICFKRTTLRFL